jgi:hypothetical protein
VRRSYGDGDERAVQEPSERVGAGSERCGWARETILQVQAREKSCWQTTAGWCFGQELGAAQKLLYLAGRGRSASDCGNDVDCVAAVTGTTAVVRLLWPTFFTIVRWW